MKAWTGMGDYAAQPDLGHHPFNDWYASVYLSEA
jgi:hypothetical protein